MDHYTLAGYQMQQQARADLAREVEIRRRIAERPSDDAAPVPGPRAAAALWGRLFHHRPVRSRPV